MIPFAAHTIAPNELAYVEQALRGGITEGDGPFTQRASQMLSALTGDRPCLLTPSCTAALELAALVLDLGPDDEVVMPSFTFTSTANAFALRGAKIRFADINPRTFSMGLAELEAAVTPRTTAVCTMHYGGVAPDIEAIAHFCDQRDIALVEDNAHGLFGASGERPLGTFGRMSAVSFHRTKNISCGEGGALFFAREEDVERAEILREKGTDRSRFMRGEVDKYTWRAVGSSYLLSDVLAAVLTAQLEAADATQQIRETIWQAYAAALDEDWAALGGSRQQIDDGVRHPAHVFALLLPPDADRAAVAAAMREHGVAASQHYEPLHTAPAHGGDERLPNTELVAAQLLRLPLHASMTDADAERAAAVLLDVTRRALT